MLNISRIWKSLLPILILAFVLTTTGCTVEKTEDGELPKVDVDVEAGKLPKYDVDTPEVTVGTKETQVTVPDIDVSTKEKTIKVPDIDVTMPNEQEETEEKDNKSNS